MDTKETINDLITKATNGDNEALETVLLEVNDLVFNLSLRMLGTVDDAKDATQDILIRIMTNLASFRKESSFQTWVYRLATNYLINYKKSMFSKQTLDFDFYANDIKAGYIDNTDDLLMKLSEEELGQELKMSCTNVMLQCLDPQTRCIFILGTMFKVDSKVAGEILDMTPENYRQKLSRARRKMASFLGNYCGLTKTGNCNCNKRVGYAIKEHRINPQKLDFKGLEVLDKDILMSCKEAMEEIDELSATFEKFPHYKSSLEMKHFLQDLLESKHIKNIQSY